MPCRCASASALAICAPIERDAATQPRVFGEIDLTHAPRAYGGLDDERANARSGSQGHVRPSLARDVTTSYVGDGRRLARTSLSCRRASFAASRTRPTARRT